MKLFILTLTFLFFGQTFVVAQGSQSYIQSMQSMLDKKNSQYESGVESVRDAYQQLMNMHLINKENIKILTAAQQKVKEDIHFYDNADFSVQANVNSALKFINWYLTDNKNVKDEAELLTKLSMELLVLKNNNPNNWTETARYKELMGIVKDLEYCDPNDIGSMGWKHGIL